MMEPPARLRKALTAAILAQRSPRIPYREIGKIMGISTSYAASLGLRGLRIMADLKAEDITRIEAAFSPKPRCREDQFYIEEYAKVLRRKDLPSSNRFYK